MSVSNVSAPTTSTTTSTSSASSQPFVPGGQLGQNSFLQLLATQLQYQNPLQPQSNSQFVAQLAQFSSLEQMTNVAGSNTQIATLMGQLAGTSQLSAAFGLLGNTVTVQTTTGAVTGAVSAVTNQNGQAAVTVNGTSYPLSAVVSASR